MWLLVLLLTGVDLFVRAEDINDITDGESSRKILGQSVVTSVSVVMDIGNGTKTIYSDPLGRPMEKPSNPSDLASPINLLNPDRYEFYTFDDNGNLVRRLMSLEEIKGIIATGDSDGLEYDPAFSESYIPEKRVNDVLSNVQNVLKEEIESHGTKLDTFHTLDTPDVSDSWNMILPAVFGNSGADITPEKPPMHVTPDTIMIEPTANSQSTSRSTSWPSSTTVTSLKVSSFSPLSSYSPPIISTLATTEHVPYSNDMELTTAEFKQTDQTTETTTKEFVPISTIDQNKVDKATTSSIQETTYDTTTSTKENEIVKLELATITSDTFKPTENDIKINTIAATELPTTQKEDFITSSIVEVNSIIENKKQETTMQSIETTVNCTSDKNEVLTTTSTSLLDDVNSIDGIAAPEILNQLLSTPLIQDINTEIMKNQITTNGLEESTTELKIETTTNLRETTSFDGRNNISSTDSNRQTVVVPLITITNNYSNQFEDTSAVPTTVPEIEKSTEKILLISTENLQELTEKINRNEDTITTETVMTENNVKLNSEIPNGGPIKSTKIETVNETVSTTINYEEIVKSTLDGETTEVFSSTTTLIPLLSFENSTSTSSLIYQNENAIRVPLIEPNETSRINSTITDQIPAINILINELQTKDVPLATTIVYDERGNTSFVPSTSIIGAFTDSTTAQYQSNQISVNATEKPVVKNTESPSTMAQMSSNTTKNPIVPISSTTTETPTVQMSSATTEKLLVGIPSNTTEKPIVQISSTTTQKPLVRTYSTTTEKLVVRTSSTTKEEPLVRITSKTTEKPLVRISSTTTEEPLVRITSTTTEKPLVRITSTTTGKPLVRISSTTTEEPLVRITSTTTEKPLVRITSTTTGKPLVRISSTTTEEPSVRITSTTTEEPLVRITSKTTEKPLVRITSTATEKPLIRISSTTTGKPLTTIKTQATTHVIITTPKNNENTLTTEKKETNWTLVPTIAPHKESTFENPPSIENYPEMLEPAEPIDLKAEPLSGFGLEDSTSSLEKDIYEFSQLYNELAFDFWKSTTSTLSHARSVVVSPFGAISLLAMIFLGARGSTSAEMNEILRLDDMITFNPHLILKNVGESIIPEEERSGVVASAIIRELFNDKGKGKLLPFYKERVRAFYDGYVEEVSFSEISDIVRRRTNLQVKKHTSGKIVEFLTDTSLTGRAPLLGLSVNIFQTDCGATTFDSRDGEMHFTVLPSIRQRRLVPIPATVYKSGFLAGYEASLDATAVAFGDKTKAVSTIFVMPGQQGKAVPGDGLARLEKSLVESSKKGAWSRLLRVLIPRSGLEVQIPKISHRSVINATYALNQMGFVELFNKHKADLMGMNGVPNELYLSDLLQVNQFTTCGERRSEHHSEIYPSRSGRNQRRLVFLQNEEHFARDLSESNFQDPLDDLSYLDLPLPLRPRQARKPDVPRLKFDRPFIYFVRHNPTGLILHIGRFNPRLLP
ncbi:mucin-2 [Diorhabda carinulata]|uniref:mucin-2 n=1 Tax=Diorhabda carinulata TaxID=1163345 RepID=UPI0025A23E40|nr:mucin-2 [Diorhabda carinulata]